MGRVQQVLPGVGVDRDAPGRQGLGVGREVASRRQQDTAVLVLHRAGGAAVPHRLAGSHHRLDAVSDIFCVRLGGIVGQEVGLHTALVHAGCAADEALSVAVGRVAQSRRHKLFEELASSASMAFSPGLPSSGRGRASPPGRRGQLSSFSRKMLGSA